jgi:hypothetical protein
MFKTSWGFYRSNQNCDVMAIGSQISSQAVNVSAELPIEPQCKKGIIFTTRSGFSAL